MKSEHQIYLLGAVCLIVGFSYAVVTWSFSIGIVTLVFAVGSTVWGQRMRNRFQQMQDIVDGLLQDKTDLKEDLVEKSQRSTKFQEQLIDEREEKEELREEKKRENQRLSNLKRALRQKGIDTDYLIDKYDQALYAPLMVLTHFSSPLNNSKKDAEFISSNLEALDTKMLHGSARIVPPRNFDQAIRKKNELQKWFDENVLGGRTDLAHKLEVISITDVSQTFDRDASVKKEGPDFKTNTVSDLFETDTVVPTEDLLDILSRSERISLEDELRENFALLVVPNASETQMDQVLEAQVSIENELGELIQIAETDIDEIEEALRKYDVDNPRELADSVKDEATRLKASLS